MKLPFYDKYTIDDANYECGRIIVADCPDSHRYATLCELVADCPEMKQLTKPCIVEFLNDMNNSKYNPNHIESKKRFLRVGIDGCLEIADPCICNDGDRFVAATDDDNDPGPLDRKVKGSCSYDGLYCIDIEETGPSTLVRRPSGPNGPFINPDLPVDECEGGEAYNVKLVRSGSNWKVDFQCPEADLKPQYAICTYFGDPGVSATHCCMKTTGTDGRQYRVGRTVRYYVTSSKSVKPIDSGEDNATSYIKGDWNVVGTEECFAAPTSYGIIKITKPGIYSIAFSTYITMRQVNKAIRCGIYIDTGSGFQELNDIKYESGEYYGYKGNNQTFNRTRPDAWDLQKWVKPSLDTNGNSLPRGSLRTLDMTGMPFSRTYNLNVTNTPVELAMVVKPDTRGIDPRLIKENDNDERYDVTVNGGNGNPFGATTTIEIARISDVVHQSRLVDIYNQ